MLSYKHGYHAGNHADVIKHIVLLYLYNIEKKNNKSISYIDTHSGNGIYKYISKYMDKNKEYKDGIKRIQNYKGNNILIKNYLSTITKITGKNNFYPGSPIFISSISSKKDKLFFCELHNNEHNLLKKNLNKYTNIKILNTDGFDYIFNKVNKEKNYFVFIDPSYEIKDDFNKVQLILNNIDNLFSKSKIIIWYPVLDILENDTFLQNIRKKGISNIINVEVPIMKYGDNIGMQGSGLLLINFTNRSIMKNLKEVINEIQNIIKQEENITRSKLRYL
tara:strand:+ start:115 stop:945 length:831 start_codon:yes stop_codon:yes gene_type:complete